MSDRPFAIIGCEVAKTDLFESDGRPRDFLTQEQGTTQMWRAGTMLVVPLWYGGKERWIAGVQFTPEDDGFRRLSPTHLIMAWDWCRSDLTELKLWDESRFGIWSGVILG